MTAIVDAIRSLLEGGSVGGDLGAALGWCTAILVAAYVVAARLFRRTAS